MSHKLTDFFLWLFFKFFYYSMSYSRSTWRISNREKRLFRNTNKKRLKNSRCWAKRQRKDSQTWMCRWSICFRRSKGQMNDFSVTEGFFYSCCFSAVAEEKLLHTLFWIVHLDLYAKAIQNCPTMGNIIVDHKMVLLCIQRCTSVFYGFLFKMKI